MAIAAALMAVGTFLPWISVKFSLGIAAMATNGKLGIAAVAALVILKVCSDKASYDDKFPTLGSGSSLDVSLSAGIYLSLLMAIAVAGLGVICAVTSKSR